MSGEGAAGAGTERLLLIRRDGVLWGVVQSAVRSVSRPGEHGGGYRLRVGGKELAVDEVVGAVDDVPVRPAGGVMTLYWGEPAGGLAVYGETPLVVVDPARPPSYLRAG